MAVLGPFCCTRTFPSCGDWGPLLAAVRGPPITVASPIAEHGLQVQGPPQLWRAGLVAPSSCGAWVSVVVAHGLSCSVACGILPDQGLNPCPLHWQADSQPLCHQGSPNRHLKLVSKS